MIEALITMTIIGILLALAVPGLQTWLFNARIRTATEEAMAGLQLARSEAVRRNCNVEFVLGVGAGWSVQALCPVATVVERRAPTEGVAGVVVTPTPVAATHVTFDGLGRRVANADGTEQLTQIDVDLLTTVLAPADSRELRINIGINGQVRMCDPNVADSADSRRCL